MKECEICRALEKLGLPKAAHDPWVCDRQEPEEREWVAPGILRHARTKAHKLAAKMLHPDR